MKEIKAYQQKRKGSNRRVLDSTHKTTRLNMESNCIQWVNIDIITAPPPPRQYSFGPKQSFLPWLVSCVLPYDGFEWDWDCLPWCRCTSPVRGSLVRLPELACLGSEKRIQGDHYTRHYGRATRFEQGYLFGSDDPFLFNSIVSLCVCRKKVCCCLPGTSTTSRTLVNVNRTRGTTGLLSIRRKPGGVPGRPRRDDNNNSII